MLKMIGGTTVLLAAMSVMTYLRAEEAKKDCGAGACPAATKATAQDKGTACPSQCPAQTRLTSTSGKSCDKACSEKLVSTSSEGQSCAASACSAAAGKSCDKASSEKLVSTGADGQSCAAAACGTSACPTAACATSACAAACSSQCSDCPVTIAMKSLPQMQYVVGEERMACPKAAAASAEKSGHAMHYAVGDKKYEDKAEAFKALVDSTEQFVAAHTQPKVCSKSGTVTFAGKKVSCAGTAAGLAKVAEKAMSKVKMTYQVGDKKCQCPVEAEKLAEQNDDVRLFVVGNGATACQTTARLNLARAKFRAAMVALMQAESQQNDASGS